MQDAEFRPLEPAHHEEFATVTDYAFSPADGPRDDAETPERIADRFGLFVDGDLASVCAHYDFTARLRGEWVPLAGLAAVATPPEHRRRGYVSRMIDASLDRWRGEYPLAALWPFDRAYYEQFGWATANEVREYACPPDALAFARGRSDDALRRVAVDEWERLQSAHESHAAGRGLTLRRDTDWWREKVFRVGEDDRPFVYAVERDDRVAGHVAYSFAAGDGGGHGHHTLSVADLAYADDDALLAVLGFLADHDSQAREVRLTAAADSGLLDRLPDPSAADCTVSQGPMVRVVDVAEALSAVPYPADASADLTLSVTDDTASWNDGSVRLRVADGAGRCERVDDADIELDATVDIGTLSQLAVGYVGIDGARRLGKLSVTDESVAERLAALFPPETVFLRDFF